MKTVQITRMQWPGLNDRAVIGNEMYHIVTKSIVTKSQPFISKNIRYNAQTIICSVLYRIAIESTEMQGQFS